MKKTTSIIIFAVLLVCSLAIGYDGYSRFDNLLVRGWLNVSDSAYIDNQIVVGTGETFLDIFYEEDVYINTTDDVVFTQDLKLQEGKKYSWDDGAFILNENGNMEIRIR